MKSKSRHSFVHFSVPALLCTLFLLLPWNWTCTAGYQAIGKLSTGFQASQRSSNDHNGLFLLSNNSGFGFGFVSAAADSSSSSFMLAIVHTGTSRVIWTANRGSPIANSDNFVFDKQGNAYLQKGGSATTIWATNTANRGVSAMELLDSGNLLLRGEDKSDSSSVVWQSFDHPTDTLISNQDFVQGMRLVSDPSSSKLSYILEIKSGDLILSASYSALQPYWSMGQDTRRTIYAKGGEGGGVASASFNANAWRFYDENKQLLWQFNYSSGLSADAIWIAVLGNDGFITFYQLDNAAATFLTRRIPADPCSTPEPCGAYFICSFTSNIRCVCPTALRLHNCGTDISSPCGEQKNDSVALVEAGHGLNYFALPYVSPSLSKTDLEGCKAACFRECSCIVLLFDSSSGNCFLFDRVGSFQSPDQGGSAGFASYVKVLSNGGGNATKVAGNGGGVPYFVLIIISAFAAVVVVLAGLIFWAWRRFWKKNRTLQGDSFALGLLRPFSFNELDTATGNFSVKLGQGGYGSVYKGTLADGSDIAVKTLESNGQGENEFGAEVRIIGGIHHHHLVRLIGYCAEGIHRMLAYEFMPKGSLDRWIFRRDTEYFLDWEKRTNIFLGIAKGLAYLHEDCDPKIVHRDIKPENVLLDDQFKPKVVDFGLAKLITAEQSIISTALKGTRGYIAPERFNNRPATTKSDVYSYGMMLLEIIAGTRIRMKPELKSLALQTPEQGNVREILDSRLESSNWSEIQESVNTAVKVAVLCIQDEMKFRPSMTEVVRMLQGHLPVHNPPAARTATYSRMGSLPLRSLMKRAFSWNSSSGCKTDGNFSDGKMPFTYSPSGSKSDTEEGNTSGPSGCNDNGPVLERITEEIASSACKHDGIPVGNWSLVERS